MSNIPLSQYVRRGFRTRIQGKIPIQQVEEAVSVPIKVVENNPPKMISANEAEPPILPKFPSILLICETVAAFYNITMADLVSPRRYIKIVRPRQIAIYLSRELTPRSYPVIAKTIGDRDHTTALHADRKIRELLEIDDRLRADIEAIKQKLSTAPPIAD